VSAIYAIVGGLFAIYLIGLLGPGIPGFSTVSRAWSGIFNNPLTDRFNRVFHATVDRSINNLSNWVYTGVNNFRRRNYYNNYYHRYYSGQNSRSDYDEVQDYFYNDQYNQQQQPYYQY